MTTDRCLKETPGTSSFWRKCYSYDKARIDEPSLTLNIVLYTAFKWHLIAQMLTMTPNSATQKKYDYSEFSLNNTHWCIIFASFLLRHFCFFFSPFHFLDCLRVSVKFGKSKSGITMSALLPAGTWVGSLSKTWTTVSSK